MFGFGYTGIIASMKKLPSGGGNGALTTAWITATSETDTTIISALNTLETDLTTYGLTAKIKALYPMVGGTAAKHKFNFMDARDLDAAFRLTFNGGWTHSSTGALPNGTNAYADTYLNTLTNLTNTSNHISYYSRTSTVGVAIEMGNLSGNYFHIRAAVNYVSGANPISFTSTSNSNGFWMGSKRSNTDRAIFKNGINEATNTVSDTTVFNNWSIYLGATNSAINNAGNYSSKQCAFSTIGDGLTNSEAANLYTAVQAFQTTLSRQV